MHLVSQGQWPPLFANFCDKVRMKVQIQEPLPVLRCLPNGIVHMHFSTMY